MTTRYRCPISVCARFHEYVASGSAPDRPADVLSWTPANWADMSDQIGRFISVAHVIDAHLVTHSPVQRIAELRLYQARAETAEDRANRLEDALQQTADVTAGVHPVTSMQLPSRAGAVGGAADV